MIKIQSAVGDNDRGDRPRMGLALAGGGALGIIYEIGATLALEQALEGVRLNDLDTYVGVSAGGITAAILSNGYSPAELCRIFVCTDHPDVEIDPNDLLRPSLELYLRGFGRLPSLWLDVLHRAVSNPRDISLGWALSTLGRALPSGLLDNRPLERFLRRLLQRPGHSNDFRKIGKQLYIPVMDLDTGATVLLGSPGYDQVPISTAAQAGAAVPLAFPPVEIDGHSYIDGAVKRTMHASVALEAGTGLLFCVAPIVPYNAKRVLSAKLGQPRRLVEGGLPVVMNQMLYCLIYSRMKVGVSRYQTQYSDRDIVLFMPDLKDGELLFTNILSFANSRAICELAYQTTRRDMLARRDQLEPLLERHDVKMRIDLLQDDSLRFDSELSGPGRATVWTGFTRCAAEPSSAPLPAE